MPKIKADENIPLNTWDVYIGGVMGSKVIILAHTDETHDNELYKEELKNIFYLYTYLASPNPGIMPEEEMNLNKGKTLATVKVNVEDLNNNIGTELEISKELFDMLNEAENIRISSNGYFDYSIGHIIDVWKRGINRYNQQEMPLDEFNLLLDEVNGIDIVNNPITLRIENNKYFVTINEGVKIDLGAFAKGYATQKAIEYLKNKGVKYYYIDSGTSSIAVGEKVDGSPYRIGLKEPVLDKKRDMYGVVELVNSTVTTSGDYTQYFTVHGQRFHHIISPKTKTPSSNYHVLSIIGQDAGLMDAASTALFSMSMNEAEIFLNEIGAKAVFYNQDLTITNLSDNVNITNIEPHKPIGRYIILGITIAISLVIIFFAVRYFIKTKDKVQKDNKLKIIRDLILFGVLIVVFGGAYLNYYFWPRDGAIKAEIIYRQETYVEVDFRTKKINVIKDQFEEYPKIIYGDEYIEITLLGDYQIDGINQEVVIVVDFKEKRIKVSEEKSPNNLCSRQGWAKHGYIICLPNSVSINFFTGTSTDGVV
ncbi:MAG: FAD:protein FMN transferase [Acholeplasmataceae bacterium]